MWKITCMFLVCFANTTTVSNSIPQSRPRAFVDHCKARMWCADNIEASTIELTGDGKFAVKKSSSHSNVRYEVAFGSENKMSLCSCSD